MKTGYFRAGGFSIAAAATRNDRRVIAVVTGCKSRPTRDDKARELLAYGFMNLPELRMPEPESEPQHESSPESEPETATGKLSFLAAIGKGLAVLGRVILVLAGLLVVTGLIRAAIGAHRRKRDNWTL